jgi:hypothetical protein
MRIFLFSTDDPPLTIELREVARPALGAGLLTPPFDRPKLAIDEEKRGCLK